MAEGSGCLELARGFFPDHWLGKDLAQGMLAASRRCLPFATMPRGFAAGQISSAVLHGQIDNPFESKRTICLHRGQELSTVLDLTDHRQGILRRALLFSLNRFNTRILLENGPLRKTNFVAPSPVDGSCLRAPVLPDRCEHSPRLYLLVRSRGDFPATREVAQQSN